MTNHQKLTKLAKELFIKLGLPEAEIKATEDESGVLSLQIDASQEDAGLLIGFHGENIQSLQLILAQIYNKDKKDWKPIVINIGDYRQKREQALKTMAVNAAQRVKITQKPVTLPYLTSSERRIVHLALSEDEEVQTISIGEGRQRKLTIELKK